MVSRYERDVYMLGPPVLHEDELVMVLKTVMDRLNNQQHVQFEVSSISEPVLYKVSWIYHGERNRPHRPGMAGMYVWCMRIQWPHVFPYRNFNVKVEDALFFTEKKHGRHSSSPAFEPFFVIAPLEGSVDEGHLFQWRTNQRAYWRLRDVVNDVLHSHHDTQAYAKSEFSKAHWQTLLKFDTLFPTQQGCSRRASARSGESNGFDLIQIREKIRFDTVLPIGFPAFLSACAPRPCSFESLCRELWLYDMEVKHGRRVPKPAWIGSPIAGNDKDSLAHSWWMAVVAQASSAVQQIVTAPIEREECHLLAGVSPALKRRLALDSTVYVSHEDMYDKCRKNGLQHYRLDLGGSQVVFFRGIRVNDIYIYEERNKC